MKRRTLVLSLPLALPAALLPRRAWAEPLVVEVRIKGHLFVPETLTIKPGTTVRWVNDERRTTHSVLFPQEGGLESERLFPGDSWTRRFDQPGRHPYTCGPHPEMKGLIIVQA
jgi:plastocyanin